MEESNLYNLYYEIRKQFEINIKNEEKFLHVVEFWFFYFGYVTEVCDNYQCGINILDNKLIRKSIFYAIDIFEDSNIDIEVADKHNGIYNLLKNLPMGKYGYLPGGVGNNNFEKLISITLSAKLKDIKVIYHDKFKEAFFSKCKECLDKSNISALKKILPDIFFSTKLKTSQFLPYNLKGSPISFLDNHYNYLKLLLQNRKVVIKGTQHGGGYGEWLSNGYEEFETVMSDKYFGWGLLQNNFIQNKYKKFSIPAVGDKRGIFWVGRVINHEPQRSSFCKRFLNHLGSVDHIEYYYSIFKKYDISLLPHPRMSHKIYNKIFNTSNQNIAKNVEYTVFPNAKLIIFDCFSHTLIYNCLYNRIPFVILIDSYPESDLTHNARKFYKLLSDNNLLISRDDENIVEKISFISEYLEHSHMNFFSEDLICKIDQIFFSHPTIDMI